MGYLAQHVSGSDAQQFVLCDPFQQIYAGRSVTGAAAASLPALAPALMIAATQWPLPVRRRS